MALAERVPWCLFASWVCLACGGNTNPGHDTDAGGVSAHGGAQIHGGTGTGGSANTSGASVSSSGSAKGGASASGTGGSTGGTSNNAGNSNHSGNASGGQGGQVPSGGSSTACGSAGAGGPAPNNSTDPNEGTVTPIWDGFCFAFFKCDYTTRSLEGPALTARAGRDYLITNFGAGSATLAYLTPGGPVTFQVKATDNGLPFTSNCQPDTLQMYSAVFNDLTVFAEPTLKTELCQLPAGTTALLDDTKPNGFFLQSINDTDSVYKIVLNTMSARCNGAEEGYIAVPATMVLGASLFLVPFNFLQAPK